MWEIGSKYNILADYAVAEDRTEELKINYPGFEDLLDLCWSKDPHQRPSIHEVIAKLDKITDAGKMK